MELTDLSTFKNIHEGKQGFVCGSGTSLSSVPKNITEQGVVFCINAAGMHFAKYDYLYLTDDAIQYMAYWDEILAKSKTVILANPELSYLADQLQATGKQVYLLTRNYDSRENYTFNDNMLCMGNDAPISALHMAWVMGLRPITLCGIDLCYDKTSRYFTHTAYDHKENSPYKESFEKDYTHGRSNLGDGNLTDKWLHQSIGPWQMAYNQNEQAHEHIFNASEISIVPGFKKIKL